MSTHDLVEFIKAHGPAVVQYVLMALGGLVVIGTAYVKATPTQDDDMWLQKLESKPIIGSILSMLIQFSPIERKEAAPVVAEQKKDA